MSEIKSDAERELDEGPKVTTVAFGFGWSYGLMILALPPLVYYMWICMRYYGGAMAFPRSQAELVELVSRVPAPSWKALGLYLGWFLLQVALQLYAPGKLKEGVPLNDGTRLKYRMNGWFTWWFTLGLIGLLIFSGLLPATLLYDEFGAILTVANIFTFLLSLYLYFHARLHNRKDRPTGRFFYDYFMGTSLNPREGGFDWKLFCEARPGLILWVLINLSIAAKQHQLHGSVSVPMMMVCLFHFWYIADYYYHEEAILSTWDIRHENFGWMLCWGDLVWVPFTYTLQAQYLLNHPHDLPVWAIVGIFALNIAGYYLFRSVNIQKHRFRSNPEGLIWGKKPEFIRTKRGTQLLTSGWWGVARHLNYTGDLMMALAWCLVCGFDNLLPYFYIIYFTILLVHREWRDNAMCRERYGEDWDAYCKRVRWRMIPGIY